MSMSETIWNYLQADTDLQSLLAKHDLDPTKIAIYEEWAERETTFPYVVYSLSAMEGDHFAKQDCTLNFDIFTYSDTGKAEDISRTIVDAIDRKILRDSEDGAQLRIYYSRDGFITEPVDYVTHWNLEFTVYHWRDNFIQHLISEGE